ncbi:MAG: cardiolipin synthase [Lachnospiraceae bacterium]|nr:cardiolipin synthase [Lachnospiraceae bacterium]
MNRKKWKKFLRVIFGRTAFVTLFLLIQIAVLFGAFKWLGDHIFFVYGGFTMLSAAVVVYIINKRQNPVYQLAWVIPVLVFPVFGAMFYIFIELQVGTRRIARRLREILAQTAPYLKQDEAVMARLSQESKREAHLAGYMGRYGGYPVYSNTYVEYFPLGDELFPRLLEELEKAERYIFMEYFIVEDGKFWDKILEILAKKAGEGVEVRFMYDGMGCLTLLPHRYPQQLERMGIHCKVFFPVKPALTSYQNNRDHRKITVIDGHTAFTGGINLADEYINETVRFGHWKDTAVMLKGEAVTSFLMMFLQMWNVSGRKEEDYKRYLRDPNYSFPPGLNREGYVMPYGDSPLDGEAVGECVYLDILNEARDYVHIMTPYLILDSDMITSLSFAAKRGVEVVIIMPHVPDKMYAYLLARSYYGELLAAGVRIFEYTPGFVHAKVFSSDGEKAVVGSVNLDYRSLYLHFECAVYLYRNQAVEAVEKDFQKTLLECGEIREEDCRRYPPMKRLAGAGLRLFAPLM